jgi:hypothetical protein
MIFATVGTQLPFDRLLLGLDTGPPRIPVSRCSPRSAQASAAFATSRRSGS